MQVMADCRVLTKGKQIMVDSDPRLHGFWGADTVTTISHQSVAWFNSSNGVLVGMIPPVTPGVVYVSL